MEKALEQALTAPEIRLHLQPLPSGSAKRRADDDDDVRVEPKKNKSSASSENERLRRQLENMQGQLRNLQSGRSIFHSNASRVDWPKCNHRRSGANLLQLQPQWL